jgi:glycosyltransferase involved in cell wall biosynthesis
MTLKEKLEILRGEPIKVFEGDPKDIPCIETSDQDRLCKNPVVSVHMITYNHEPYIRQAIEGVMMQKTDFEFELVIGEDCSRDKTREICFEYQKKYPDKIRVLWWHENVSRFGGNARRVTAHCRGKFVALCEGDDYWIDPLKLQKQLDVMNAYPSVGLCFCKAKRYIQETERFADWPVDFSTGVIPQDIFYSMMVDVDWWPRRTVATATVMLRNDLRRKVYEKYDIFNWCLSLGDLTMWTGLSMKADVYFSPEVVAVYRINSDSLCGKNVDRVNRDAYIVKEYYVLKRYGVDFYRIPRDIVTSQLRRIIYADTRCPLTTRFDYTRNLFELFGWNNMLLRFMTSIVAVVYLLGVNSVFIKRMILKLFQLVLRRNSIHFKL